MRVCLSSPPMSRALLLLLAGSPADAVAHALLSPFGKATPLHPSTRSPSPNMGGAGWDTPDFLNDPINFMAKNPQYFSEDLQAMVAYQLKVKGDELRLWGDLPEALDVCTKAAAFLRQKSATADELARIIMSADQEMLQTLIDDAKFEEKKAFFQAIASLPPDDNGMLAIHDVADGMLQAGQLPLIPQFERDLEHVAAKVDEVNDLLMNLDQQYSTLFLSVRKVSKFARAAAEVNDEAARKQLS
ncbi:MAG: hypothetical protein SGPRY_003021 [Prymnesium sp.]